ncbi:MAG: hypothetical protein ACRC11_04615 [Xenococcaceae cyanobacterium]
MSEKKLLRFILTIAGISICFWTNSVASQVEKEHNSTPMEAIAFQIS